MNAIIIYRQTEHALSSNLGFASTYVSCSSASIVLLSLLLLIAHPRSVLFVGQMVLDTMYKNNTSKHRCFLR
ncbi:hypothetical protein M5D96_000283, partial [Drosophila gunungcola]